MISLNLHWVERIDIKALKVDADGNTAIVTIEVQHRIPGHGNQAFTLTCFQVSPKKQINLVFGKIDPDVATLKGTLKLAEAGRAEKGE